MLEQLIREKRRVAGVMVKARVPRMSGTPNPRPPRALQPLVRAASVGEGGRCRRGNLSPVERRKRRRAFDEPGHAHELTFSCCRRQPLLDEDAVKKLFLECLDEGRLRLGFKVWAYVVMPEHVHLLVHSGHKSCKVSSILTAAKSEFAKLPVTGRKI
ncbi:MAG: transposase [Fimbriimonadales bacterium]